MYKAKINLLNGTSVTGTVMAETLHIIILIIEKKSYILSKDFIQPDGVVKIDNK